LHQKVDTEFGETEKPFSSPNDLKVKDNQDPTSSSSSTSFSNRIEFPKLMAKDSKILRKKVMGEIQKDYKARSASCDFAEYFGELSSSSSSDGSSSASYKKEKNEIYDDLDKQVIKDLEMDNADLFYYKMDSEFKDLDNMIKTHSSIFGEKKLVPPIHNSKWDITGYMMQKNAQNFAALGEIFYKFSHNNDIEAIKEFSAYQVREAVKLGT
jgi:hypothetical protein